ncbi:MAG: MerR family transcriptional regulator [Proteobacteria bacterium]|nr:MerR family transcriptional regulator [Pseudomonadota bacterium]
MRNLAMSQPHVSAPMAAQPARPAEDTREWTISEMARDFGVTLRTLRFYEARGLITPQRFGGARYYSQKDRSRLKLVLAAKQMGFTLTEAANMLGKSEGADTRGLPLSPTAVESQITFLEGQRRAIEQALTALRARLGEMVPA